MMLLDEEKEVRDESDFDGWPGGRRERKREEGERGGDAHQSRRR